MNNRIDLKFQNLRRQGKKAFIAFITAGDPSLKTTEELVLAFEKNGVDIVEIGMPFSDPLADGPTIQESYQRSLKKHTTLAAILKTIQNIRRRSQIPIALMTSYNPIFHFGEEKFVARAQEAGIDGVIIPDLPPEEAQKLIKAARRINFSTIFFISPTTTPERAKKVIAASTGFIYYVSLTGVTGSRKSISPDLKKNILAVKRLTNKPVCAGFGISTSQQVREVCAIADGVIVGSAIVRKIAENAGKKDLVKKIADFVKGLNHVSKNRFTQ
ncbi:MAG TPA: tryptophan synthase subunit alpha [Candidatus Omnitrophota bacterium]|nr:tryptophan synthase subunit alpha [Candidatus Omnitrophota bacterium]